MANPNITKLPAIPWPALAGASLLLHAGVLSVGLPKMLPVSNPTGADDIPITLVDDQVLPVAPVPPTVQPTVQPTSPAASPQPTPTTPAPPKKPTPVTSTGEQDTTRRPPRERREVTPQTPAPSQTPPPPATPPTSSAQPNPPTQPETAKAPTVTEPGVPEQQPPQDNSTEHPAEIDGGGTDTTTEDETAQSSTGPTQVKILADVQLPKNSGSDQIDQYPRPNFQMPVTFDIPANHSCQGTLSNNVINLGVFIDADGVVYSLRHLQSDIYAQNADLNLADCLWSVALANRSLRFSPATRLNNIGEAEDVPSDSIQLRLQFSEG